jgi:AraC-like DNA-binding protein
MFHSVVHDPPEPARALMSATLRAALAQAEPPPWLLKYPLQLSSPTARQVLWALGRRLSQNPDVGFVVASDVPEDALGSLWQLYEVVPTLRTLTAHYNEWAPLLLDFARGTVRDDGELTWFDTRTSSGIRLDRAEQDFRVFMTLKYWRRLTGTTDLTPAQVHFAYPRPTSLAWHTRLLGNAGLRFSQPYLQIALPRARADARLPGANEALYETRRTQARAAASALVKLPISQRVEALITERLVHATHEVEVATLLGLSVRSLRRKLAVGGVSFRALLARARERERELFVQAALSSAETARLLGFANRGALRNSLQRAARP